MSFFTTLPADLRPAKSIIVCSTGRSGSTLLCRTLSSLNCAGRIEEFFVPERLARNRVHSSADELYRYLPKVYSTGTTSNQVFGIKLHWDHMKTLTQIARSAPGLTSKSNLEILSLLFPNPRFIFIRRDDVTKQAISAAISYQTNIYTISKESDKRLSDVEQTLFFNPLNIYRYKQGLQARNHNWKSFFKNNNLPYFEVVYEDLIDSFATTTQEILDFLEIELPDPDIEISAVTKKVGNATNERWNYYYNLIPEGLLAFYSQVRSQLRQILASKRV